MGFYTNKCLRLCQFCWCNIYNKKNPNIFSPCAPFSTNCFDFCNFRSFSRYYYWSLSSKWRCSFLKHFGAHSHSFYIQLPWFRVRVTHTFGATPKNSYFEPHPPFRGKRLPVPMQHMHTWSRIHNIGKTPCYLRGPTLNNWVWLFWASFNRGTPLACASYFSTEILNVKAKYAGIKWKIWDVMLVLHITSEL